MRTLRPIAPVFISTPVLAALAALAACDSGAASPADATTTSASDATTASDGDATAAADATATSATDATTTADATGATGATDATSTGTTAPDTSTGATGPGIAAAPDVACMVELTPALGFYFGAQKHCTSYSGNLSETTVTFLEYECTQNTYAHLVDACPTEGVVAYCAGQRFSADGPIDMTKAVYESEINPNAIFVAANKIGICQLMADLFDADDQRLEPTCTGTLTATIDGVETALDEQFTCLARTDGARTSYLVRGIKHVDLTTNQELTLSVISDGTTPAAFFNDLNNPAFGYLAGPTAADAYPFPVAGEAPTFTATRYDMDGAGFTATFHLGRINASPTGSGKEVVITGGTIDVHLD